MRSSNNPTVRTKAQHVKNAHTDAADVGQQNTTEKQSDLVLFPQQCPRLGGKDGEVRTTADTIYYYHFIKKLDYTT